jgi:hypothetical protein
MAVILTNQFFDYPMYFVEILLGDDETLVAFWLGSFGNQAAISNYPGFQGTGPTDSGVSGMNTLPSDTGFAAFSGSDAYGSMLAALKTWAEDFDWATFTGIEGITFTSMKVTKYAEASADASPS